MLTVEGGTATIEGPTFVTGIGRVQVTDVDRPWMRANFNTLHWNFLGYYDQRKAEDQVALSSGALLFEDSSNLHGEVQGNVGFAGGKGFLVGGIAYHEQEVDTANDAGVQTLMDSAKKEDQQAAFGQLEYSFTAKLKARGRRAGGREHAARHAVLAQGLAGLRGDPEPHASAPPTTKRSRCRTTRSSSCALPAGAPITAFAPLEAALAPFLGGQTLGLRSIPILALGNDEPRGGGDHQLRVGLQRHLRLQALPDHRLLPERDRELRHRPAARRQLAVPGLRTAVVPAGLRRRRWCSAPCGPAWVRTSSA